MWVKLPYVVVWKLVFGGAVLLACSSVPYCPGSSDAALSAAEP